MDESAEITVGHNKVPYTILANALLRDNSITLEARGLMANLLSNAPGWTVSVKAMTKYLFDPTVLGVMKGGHGKTQIYRIMDELMLAGYLKRDAIYKDGRVEKITYTLHAEPLPLKDRSKKVDEYNRKPVSRKPESSNSESSKPKQLKNKQPKELTNERSNNEKSVGQAPRPHAPATADDLMPAHLRGWLENNQPSTGELLDTDQALAQLEANAPYKAAIIQASRDKRETGRNSAPLREAAQRARELGFMPEQILAAFSMADGSYWRSTSFGRNGERPYVSNICQMIDEAAGNKPLTGDAADAVALLLRVKARTMQPHELNRPELNGAGKLALMVAKANKGMPWLDNATPEAIRAAVASVGGAA